MAGRDLLPLERRHRVGHELAEQLRGRPHRRTRRCHRRLRSGRALDVQRRRCDPLPAQRRRPRRVLVQRQVLRRQRIHRTHDVGGVRHPRGEDRRRAPGQGERLPRRRLRSRPLLVGRRLPDERPRVGDRGAHRPRRPQLRACARPAHHARRWRCGVAARHLRRRRSGDRQEPRHEPRSPVVGRLPVQPDLADPRGGDAGDRAPDLGGGVQPVRRQRGRRPVGHVVAHLRQAAQERQDLHDLRRDRPRVAGRAHDRPPRVRTGAGRLDRQAGRVELLLRHRRDVRGLQGRDRRGARQPLLHALQHGQRLDRVGHTRPRGRKERRRGVGGIRFRAREPGQSAGLHGGPPPPPPPGGRPPPPPPPPPPATTSRHVETLQGRSS
jgi:hypothetical protein